MNYAITWAESEPKPYTNEYGTTYYYQVKGTYDGQEKATSLGVKDTAKAPKVGDVLYGHWETKNGKEKFVKEQRPEVVTSPLPLVGSSPTPHQPTLFNGHKDTASIERQVALKAMVEASNGALEGLIAGKDLKETLKNQQLVFIAYLKLLQDESARTVKAAPVAETYPKTAPEVMQKVKEAGWTSPEQHDAELDQEAIAELNETLGIEEDKAM